MNIAWVVDDEEVLGYLKHSGLQWMILRRDVCDFDELGMRNVVVEVVTGSGITMLTLTYFRIVDVQQSSNSSKPTSSKHGP